MKKLLLFVVLCFSFTVNAEMITPDGLIYAAPVEQDEKVYSVILANDSSKSVVANSFNINNKFKTSTLEKNRPLSYRFISLNILSVENVLHSDLSPLKPDKPKSF